MDKRSSVLDTHWHGKQNGKCCKSTLQWKCNKVDIIHELRQDEFVIDHNDETMMSMIVVENGKPLESYAPPLAPKPVAKIEDPTKIKSVAVQKNPQKMALDKTLFFFILENQ